MEDEKIASESDFLYPFSPKKRGLSGNPATDHILLSSVPEAQFLSQLLGTKRVVAHEYIRL